jgi:hypothetical protein
MAELSRGCPVSEGINYVIICSSKHFNIRIGCIGVQFLAHLSLAQLSFSDRKVFRRIYSDKSQKQTEFIPQ